MYLSKLSLFLLFMAVFIFAACNKSEKQSKRIFIPSKKDSISATKHVVHAPQIDTALYNSLLLHLAHDIASANWPVKTAYPFASPILPFKRIVAYYGNFYSARMGVLGALPPDEMLKRLQFEVKAWEK